jgi:hypothetical protein
MAMAVYPGHVGIVANTKSTAARTRFWSSH